MNAFRFDSRRLALGTVYFLLLGICTVTHDEPVWAGAFVTEVAKFNASDEAADDFFGWLVDIDDETAIVGNFPLAAGAAYLYDTSTFQQTHKLTVPGVTAGNYFGSVMSIGGNTALVGAPAIRRCSRRSREGFTRSTFPQGRKLG